MDLSSTVGQCARDQRRSLLRPLAVRAHSPGGPDVGAVAASAAEGADLVWRTGYYEPLGSIENDLCSAASPACADERLSTAGGLLGPNWGPCKSKFHRKCH